MNTKKKAQLLATALEERRAGRRVSMGTEVGEAGLVPLLELAAQLEAVRHPQLDPAVLTTSLVHVREELAARRRPAGRHVHRVGRLAWAALALILALVLAATGTVLAAGDSLPGDLLYPVKRGSEAVQLALTWRPENRSELLMSFAGRRLEEVAAVCTGDDCPEELLADLASQTEAAVAEIERLPSGKRAGLWEKMVWLTENQQEVLVAVLARAPASAQPGLERALERSQHGHERARQALEKEKGPEQKPPSSPHTPKPTKEPSAKPTRKPQVKPTKAPSKPEPVGTPGPKKPTKERPAPKDGESD